MRRVSSGSSVTGSKVFGWYQLDKTVDDYNNLGQAAFVTSPRKLCSAYILSILGATAGAFFLSRCPVTVI